MTSTADVRRRNPLKRETSLRLIWFTYLEVKRGHVLDPGGGHRCERPRLLLLLMVLLLLLPAAAAAARPACGGRVAARPPQLPLEDLERALDLLLGSLGLFVHQRRDRDRQETTRDACGHAGQK